MIYLDYSAHTPMDEELIENWASINRKFVGNANSLHYLGTEARELLSAAVLNTANLLKVLPEELIFTSGASESNNTVIKAMRKFKNRGKTIITSSEEHASIYTPLHYLIEEGFKIVIIPEAENSPFDLEKFKEELNDDVVLVSTTMVASETGSMMPIQEIKEILKDYPKIFFHVDGTQALGKIPISLEGIDFASFSAHKIFGPLGVGLLYKRKGIEIDPLIHGGKSQSKYRGGTPDLAGIVTFSKAIKMSLETLLEDLEYVRVLNSYLREELLKLDEISINSREDALPYILNISYFKMKPETFLHYLENKNIFISTQTACSSRSDFSKSVLALTNSMDKAKHSVRISLSKKTTKKELDKLIEVIKNAK